MKAVTIIIYVCLLSLALAYTLSNAPALGQSIVSSTEGCPIGGYTIMDCPVMTDNIIAQTIRIKLSGYMKPGNNNVVINVNGGVVTLYGTASSDEQRAVATIAASETRGVIRVINNIRVCAVSGPDFAILRSVRDALNKSPYDVQQVQVYVNNGVVTLQGFTIDEFNRTQIGLLAESIPGVTAVHNDIFLGGSPLTQ